MNIGTRVTGRLKVLARLLTAIVAVCCLSSCSMATRVFSSASGATVLRTRLNWSLTVWPIDNPEVTSITQAAYSDSKWLPEGTLVTILDYRRIAIPDASRSEDHHKDLFVIKDEKGSFYLAYRPNYNSYRAIGLGELDGTSARQTGSDAKWSPNALRLSSSQLSYGGEKSVMFPGYYYMELMIYFAHSSAMPHFCAVDLMEGDRVIKTFFTQAMVSEEKMRGLRAKWDVDETTYANHPAFQLTCYDQGGEMKTQRVQGDI